MGKPTGPPPPITPSRPELRIRSRRAIRIILRQGSEADGVIADWIDALHAAGLEHSAAIRNILRACIEGQPFLTPLRYTHYVPQSAQELIEKVPPELGDKATAADMLLVKQLRLQIEGVVE